MLKEDPSGKIADGEHRFIVHAQHLIFFGTTEEGEYKLLPEDYKQLQRITRQDTAMQSLHIDKLTLELLRRSPYLPPHLVTTVLDYTGHTLQVSLETDPVGTAYAKWGDGNGYRTLLSMVKRLEEGGKGVIVRAILPFGRKKFPCELLLVEPDYS